MKFALVNGQRQEAQPNLSGECHCCRRPMVAKCGKIRIRHWAHKGGHHCDPWWENETEWHRAWKDQFPINWQEVGQKADNGVWHIADVVTDHGWVLEFQHSPIPPAERRSRATFYRNLVWVVDGMRRKKDSAQLLRAWDEGVQVAQNFPLRRVFAADSALIRDWAGANTPVLFDFAEQPVLWWLFARSSDGPAYIAPYQREVFIECHRGSDPAKARQFDDLVNNIPKLIAEYESYLRAQAPERDPLQVTPRRGRNPRRF